MRKPTLAVLANQYHEHLLQIKAANPLKGVQWYPWASLAGMDTLDGFVGGSVDKLQNLIAGEPVLDVGCGDGDVAFFLESLGAAVDAIDHAPTNYNALLGVHRLKELLGSKLAIYPVDLDQRPRLPGQNYGLTVMLGVLYHLKNPFLVLETLARQSRHIFLSTRIASLTPDRKLSFGALPMAYLVDEDELNQDPTNYWIFSEAGLKRLVRRCGWDIRHYTTVGPPAKQADPVAPEGDVRAYILAESRVAPAASLFHLAKGWYSLEYDTWRWTQPHFGVVLHVAHRLAPATLRLVFHLPEETMAARPSITMSARVNGAPLPAVRFSSPGEQEYAASLPLLEPGRVHVEFELAPGLRHGGDQRELGVLVEVSRTPPVTLS